MENTYLRNGCLIIVVAFIMLYGDSANASSIPYCWTVDQPNRNIKDGYYRIFIPTAHHDAVDLAKIFYLFDSRNPKPAVGAYQTGAGTTETLDRIEIDVSTTVNDWKPTAPYPTREAFKAAIVQSMMPLLDIPEVSVDCADAMIFKPPGGGPIKKKKSR